MQQVCVWHRSVHIVLIDRSIVMGFDTWDSMGQSDLLKLDTPGKIS